MGDSWQDYDHEYDMERGDEENLTRCKHCGVQCYWEQIRGGWRLLQYSTDKPHQCRVLLRDRIADPDEF